MSRSAPPPPWQLACVQTQHEIAFTHTHTCVPSRPLTAAADDGDLAALLNGTPSASRGSGGAKAAAVPVLPPLVEQEAIAASRGIIDASPDRFAKAFNPDGVPWALTGE